MTVLSPFVELFDESKQFGVGKVARIQRDLPQVLLSAGMDLWHRGDSIPQSGKRTLVGIAPYSRYDFQVLDELLKMQQAQERTFGCLQVFDMLDCKEMKELDDYVPGIGTVRQTPVVGVWIDGVLVEKEWGWKGRQLLGVARVL